VNDFLSFDDWLTDPRNGLAGDPVWRLTAFKRALYCADLA